MAKKKTAEEVVEPAVAEEPVFEEVVEPAEEPAVYDVEELYRMKFRTKSGGIVKVRKAFKPRGKLEFYPGR